MQAGRIPLLLSSTLIAVACSRPARGDVLDLDDPVLGRGQLSLSARVAHETSWTGRRHWLGVVALVVPLERFAHPRVVRPRALAADPSPAEPPAAPEPAPEPVREVEIRLTPELARATVRAALRSAGHGRSRRRLDGLSARAKSSALLPELRLRGARTTDESSRYAPTTSDPYRYTQAGGATLSFEARLTWKLDRLVFADEEIHVERLRGQRAAAAKTLVREVLKLLAVWQRAQVRAGDPGLSPEERLEATLDAVEAEAALDVLTDGWFSGKTEKRVVKRRAPR